MNEAEKKDFRYLVRIANTDLDGNKNIIYALRKIKGVGYSFANAVCSIANINKEKKAGELEPEEVSRLNETIKGAANLVPGWLLNRKKDPQTGANTHLLTGELEFAKESDIRVMKKLRSYRGIRHSYGLPVRGQRTRSNFRKNKGKVLGVTKKKVKAGK